MPNTGILGMQSVMFSTDPVPEVSIALTSYVLAENKNTEIQHLTNSNLQHSACLQVTHCDVPGDAHEYINLDLLDAHTRYGRQDSHVCNGGWEHT